MVKYMKKYRIYVFCCFCRMAGCGRTEAGVRGGRSFRKTAAIMAASQVQEKEQGQDTAEELQTGRKTSLNIKGVSFYRKSKRALQIWRKRAVFVLRMH